MSGVTCTMPLVSCSDGSGVFMRRLQWSPSFDDIPERFFMFL